MSNLLVKSVKVYESFEGCFEDEGFKNFYLETLDKMLTQDYPKADIDTRAVNKPRTRVSLDFNWVEDMNNNDCANMYEEEEDNIHNLRTRAYLFAIDHYSTIPS